VLAPLFEEAAGAVRYLRFLDSPEDHIQVQYTRFEDEAWNADIKRTTLAWPKGEGGYPSS